jgi:MFS transporter, FHS family, L-fucose permease
MMWRRRAVKPPTDDEKVVVPAELSKAQFIYAYSLITSLFFAWGFAYGLLDSLNK